MAGDRPYCLMPDADIIIFLHRAGLWETVTAAFRVHVPSTIIHEAQFFVDSMGDRHRIDLPAQAADGHIVELAASIEEITALLARFHTDLLEGLHDGEREALALVLSGSFGEGWFCSGDRLALEALAALDLDGRGVSLETALRGIGRSLDRQMRLASQLTESYFESAIAKGRQRRLTGEGLSGSIWDTLRRSK